MGVGQCVLVLREKELALGSAWRPDCVGVAFSTLDFFGDGVIPGSITANPNLPIVMQQGCLLRNESHCSCGSPGSAEAVLAAAGIATTFAATTSR